MKLLLIEDDQATADHLCKGLSENGHQVDHHASGLQGFNKASAEKYDALIVDRMLPELDGLSLVKKLRELGNLTPVLMLTTMSGLDDRVEGLEAGADDYLVKPFAMIEVVARLNALTRRPQPSSVQTTLQVGEVEMNLISRDVRRANKLLDLQPQEYKLLEYLMRSESRIVTKTMLLEHVWGFHFDPQTTVVETHMSRLRAKLDKGFEKAMLQTTRGVGYRLVV
jgi:two-component system, OmpR family, response regulator